MRFLGPPSSVPVSWRELLIFAGGALVVAVIQIALLGAYDLITRPLWFDECLTALLASDASFAHEMRALRGGADANTPGLYVVLRPMKWTDAVSAEGLRWWSLLWTIAAMTAMYAYARRFAPPAGAVTAAMILWAHPLVMAHAFEARFYGPLLAATALVALALERRGLFIAGSGSSGTHHAALAAAAILLCALHYFGVLILLIMAAGVLIARRRKLAELWPAGAGVVVPIACLPFYLGQRESFAVTDWMEPVSAASVAAMLAELVPIAVLAVVAMAWTAVVIRRLSSRRERKRPEGSGSGARLASEIPRVAAAPFGTTSAPAAMLALLSMPVVLIAVSLLVQPVLMGRYAIAFALGLAAAGVWILRDAPRAVLVATSVALFALSCWQMLRMREFQMTATARLAYIANGVDQAPGPAVFQSGFDALPVWVNFPQLRLRVRVLEENLDERAASRKAQVVRAQMRNVWRFYDVARPVSAQQALSERAFAYVPWEDNAAPALPAGYRVQRINPFVYVIARE